MDREEILKLAEDSMLELSEEEITRFQEDFKTMKEKYDILEEFDTEGFEPLFSTLENKVINRFSKDEVSKIDEDIREQMLDREKMVDDFYQVPNKEGN